MEKKYEIIDRIIEIEIYLYIIFIFLTKGEGIRNILLFSAFFLWLATLKYRRNKLILKEPVPILFWVFWATILTSVVFSIDPLYSFKSLRDYPLKSLIIFCLISTTLADEKRLKRFVYISYVILVFTVSVGYYSYWAYDLPLMKPVTSLRHAWHARFAIDINTLLPFTLVIFLITKDIRLKILLFVTIVAAVAAVILSTSRGGIAGFLTMAVIWLIYISKRYRLNMKLILSGIILVVIISGTILYSSPQIKARFSNVGRDIVTLNERTDIWKPLVYAASQRPVFGWGYGSEIFKKDLPFENTPFKVAPVNQKSAFRNPHNPFLRIFFHQGIVGLIPYATIGEILKGQDI